MNTMPITPNIAPSNTKAAPTNNNAATAEDAAPPFGSVLARQLNSKTSEAEDKTKNSAKKADKTDDSNVVQDSSQNTGLPIDMLATILPQAAAAVAAQSTPVTSTAGVVPSIPLTPSSTDKSTAITEEAGKPNLNIVSTPTTAPQAPLTAELKSELVVTPELKPNASKPDVQQASLGKESFANMLAQNSADTMSAKSIAQSAFSEKNSLSLPIQDTASNAALMQSMSNLNPVVTNSTQLMVNTPITAQDRWAEDVGQKITWLAGQQDQHAELHLNPPQLGPLDVVLKVTGDQATVQFSASHAVVREALEQSIPKLREMLADNGIMLGNATVSDQAPREQRGDSSNTQRPTPNNRTVETSNASVIAPSASTLTRHNGMVDTFA